MDSDDSGTNIWREMVVPVSRQACLPSVDLEWLRKNGVNQSSLTWPKNKPTIIVIAARKDLSLLQKFQTSYFNGYRGNLRD